tara:strand:+ start:80 stop:616 length:537 start_codon:yes stop_codon:yes gene_type:complete
MLTLIIPIGPPGSGKTTLKTILEETITTTKFYSSSRDEEYKKVIEEYHSKKKARRVLFDRMQNFFIQINQDTSDNIIIYMDSCNGKQNIRDKFIEVLNPSTIIYINFRFQNIEFLLSRTQAREYHPTFPSDLAEQRETILNCLKGISYQTSGDQKTVIIDISNEKEHESLVKQILNNC